MRPVLMSFVLLLSCEPEFNEKTPPTVYEPAANFVSDRTLLKVRMTNPGDTLSTKSARYNGSATGAHVNYRINGGESQEILKVVTDTDPAHPFVFGATVIPGDSTLELGRCNAVDSCGWTSVKVSVQLKSGSPDADFAKAGQFIDTRFGRVEGVTVLSDGRVVVAAEALAAPFEMSIAMFKADGAPDTTWGKKGIATLVMTNVHAWLMARPGGGIFCVFSRLGSDQVYLARFDAAGTLDLSFGLPAVGAGVRGIPWTGTHAGTVLAATADTSGQHMLLAGEIVSEDGLPNSVPYILTLDFNGAIASLKYLDATAARSAQEMQSAWIEPDGRSAFLRADSVTRASLTGVETGFGTGGTVTLPAGSKGAVLARLDGSVLVARTVVSASGNINAHVISLTATGAISTFDIETNSPSPQTQSYPLVFTQSAARAYLATTIDHPTDNAHSWIKDQPGTDIGVYGISAGALDVSFGKSGSAWVSFANSWAPLSTENLLDVPIAAAVDAAGKPIVVGGSSTPGPASQDTYTKRGPAGALVRFLP